MEKRYETLNSKLKDEGAVEFVLILNEDELSFSESLLIKREMDELNFKLHRLLINKATQNNQVFYDRIIEAFPSSTIDLLPISKTQVTSIVALEEFYGQLKTIKK
jgi:arsenite-transporting ATPase